MGQSEVSVHGLALLLSVIGDVLRRLGRSSTDQGHDFKAACQFLANGCLELCTLHLPNVRRAYTKHIYNRLEKTGLYKTCTPWAPPFA